MEMKKIGRSARGGFTLNRPIRQSGREKEPTNIVKRKGALEKRSDKTPVGSRVIKNNT